MEVGSKGCLKRPNGASGDRLTSTDFFWYISILNQHDPQPGHAFRLCYIPRIYSIFLLYFLFDFFSPSHSIFFTFSKRNSIPFMHSKNCYKTQKYLFSLKFVWFLIRGRIFFTSVNIWFVEFEKLTWDQFHCKLWYYLQIIVITIGYSYNYW